MQAIKAVRTVTATTVPIKWDTDFEHSGSNGLCNYIKAWDLHDTGTFKSGRCLRLKDAVDICRFIKANIDLFNYDEPEEGATRNE